MTKGRTAASLKDEAKECAERMGYHWTDNTDPSVKFDGLMYRTEYHDRGNIEKSPVRDR